MIIDKGIPIKNVYYMLTYAFKELKRNNYEQIAGENFEDIHDLFAEILSIGIAYLLKQGIHRQYVIKEEELQTLRGKLSMQETIKKRMNRILAENTGRPVEEVTAACERDNFMSADEAKEFGLIDKIILPKKSS